MPAPWWQHAAIYQIYVRSFQDSNGDGVGDLPGVTQRLDHLQALGVDALWLTPFFPSPNADFGYDVADYCDVAPEYGTLADFDELVRQARARGLRVLVDFVLNHTSDQHPWFRAARSDRHHPQRDWYVWRDSGPDGGPPTNWRSVFGGPAWTQDPASGQWYYHAFLPQQPDLNWHHPGVRAAMAEVARFWLRRGVAGFRLDATAFLFEDPSYPPDPAPDTPGRSPLQPWNAGRPENHAVLRDLRQVLAEFPGEPVLLGESATDTLAELRAAYGETGDEIQLPMNFLFGRHWQRDAPGFKRLIDDSQAALAEHTPVHFFSNHDHWRQYNAFGDGRHDEAIARLTATLTLAPRGTALLYYGEEIGMADLPDAELAAAPLGPHRPRADARDRARSPMQWTGLPGAGFCPATVTPWLPLPRDWGTHHVAAQQAEPASLLNWYRALLRLRREDATFRHGAHVPLDSGHAQVLAFGRRGVAEGGSDAGTDADAGFGIVVLLNFSAQAQAVRLYPDLPWHDAELLLAHPPAPACGSLAPFGVQVFRTRMPSGCLS